VTRHLRILSSDDDEKIRSFELFGEGISAAKPRAEYPAPGPKELELPEQAPPAPTEPSQPDGKLSEDLQYCISRMTQAEDLVDQKIIRYEELIRELLKEKQRTEKNDLGFKRIETEVVKLKNLGYAIAVMAALAIARSFAQ